MFLWFATSFTFSSLAHKYFLFLTIVSIFVFYIFYTFDIWKKKKNIKQVWSRVKEQQNVFADRLAIDFILARITWPRVSKKTYWNEN